MKKTKHYYKTKFSETVIKEAFENFSKDQKITYKDCLTTTGDEEWGFDTIEEFFTEYKKAEEATLVVYLENNNRLRIFYFGNQTVCTVESNKRDFIESIFGIYEKYVDSSKIVVSKKPIKIFIGHGRDLQWKDLKDELHEKHGFAIEAYEIGPRAGKSVKEILQEMLAESDIALLVMTGEDVDNSGKFHARENVIHEAGLFQGHLGFERALIIKEDSVEEFSNILGLNQIRFEKGHIKETITDIIATIRSLETEKDE